MSYKNEITFIIGDYQSGRTTLAETIADMIGGIVHKFDYDSPDIGPKDVFGTPDEPVILMLDDARVQEAALLCDRYAQCLEDLNASIIIVLADPYDSICKYADNIIFMNEESMLSYYAEGVNIKGYFNTSYRFIRLSNDGLHKTL